MIDAVRYCVVMPAAGAGRRMTAGDKPKQYLSLLDKPVIEWSLSTFIADERCVAIVVALSKDDVHWPTLPISKHPKIRTTYGGAERVDSVRNGLLALQGNANPKEWATEWILVHDAARPCLQRSDVDALLDGVSADQGLAGGLLAIPVADTVKQVDHNKVINTVPRNNLWRAQTPQMFRFDVLHRALHSAHVSRVTDESSAVELLGYQPRIVAGRTDNIKITVADDLLLAEYILKSRTS
ncbi:MAG: 2-C-methyl-D-erythritol 4-phosphate cytidylyltransferase [Steroidobacter sp.]